MTVKIIRVISLKRSNSFLLSGFSGVSSGADVIITTAQINAAHNKIVNRLQFFDIFISHMQPAIERADKISHLVSVLA